MCVSVCLSACVCMYGTVRVCVHVCARESTCMCNIVYINVYVLYMNECVEVRVGACALFVYI